MELRSKEGTKALEGMRSQPISLTRSGSFEAELERFQSETDGGRYRYKPPISETDDPSKKYPPNDSLLYTYRASGKTLVIELKSENNADYTPPGEVIKPRKSPPNDANDVDLISFEVIP